MSLDFCHPVECDKFHMGMGKGRPGKEGNFRKTAKNSFNETYAPG
jgi:hypothetical protein